MKKLTASKWTVSLIQAFTSIRTILVLVAAITALTLTACGGSNSLPMCERLADCGSLAKGLDAYDCMDTYEKIEEDISTRKFNSFNRKIGRCLEENNCREFTQCVHTTLRSMR